MILKDKYFFLFDDDAYFEIYGYGSMKGAGGIDKDGLDKVLKLNFPTGKGEGHKWTYLTNKTNLNR